MNRHRATDAQGDLPDAHDSVLHDINNVLSTIVMHADLLLEESVIDGAANEHVREIVAAVDRGSAIVRRAMAGKAAAKAHGP